MKKHAAKVLLPLLFSCLFLFSGFLNVKVRAYSSEYHLYPVVRRTYFSANIDDLIARKYLCTVESNNEYIHQWASTLSSTASYDSFLFGDHELNFYYPYDPTLYDYYVLGSFSVNFDDSSDINFNYLIDSLEIVVFDEEQNSIDYVLTDSVFYDSSNYNSEIHNFVFPLNDCLDLSAFKFNFSPSITIFDRAHCKLSFQAAVLAVQKDSSTEQVASIIAAINNQTDQITGSIEDQYSGSPENSFNTEGIITQHNEKMGVLSFGSDVMLQFLDLFQSANVGAAQLTLPGFNITVQDVNYQVWEDQTFNFSQLEQWVPGLIDVIRLILPAFVWLMVLRYCIQVFERNFLSK